MKTAIKTFLFLFIVALSSANANAQEPKQKTVHTAVIKTAIYCDHCKACESCGDRLEKTLLKEKGIQMITLDEKAMTIKVVYNSKKTDLTKIKTAISKLGYDADDIKADAIAYEGLDGCCKR
ncbi:MAG: MerP protein [Flavobacterium psychrophilum]|nr:MAG: MerP protein [Flavobacterium psychrophilum]